METNIQNNDFMMNLRDLSSFIKCSPQAIHKSVKDKGLEAHLKKNKLYLSPEATRVCLISRGFIFKKQIISIQMLKGGTGKTTTAANIAIRANMYGARVLMIDLDQQANLSFAFGAEDENSMVWIDIMEGTCTIEQTIKILNPCLHIIPSNLNNSLLDKVVSDGKRNIAKCISEYLKPIKDNYDLIILDTGPNLGAINAAASIAADTIILPINPDKFSLSGLNKTLHELECVAKDFNYKINPKILFTRFDGRESASHEILKKCYVLYSDKMLKGFIRTSSEIKKKINSSDTIYDKKSPAKEDYDVVTREILGF